MGNIGISLVRLLLEVLVALPLFLSLLLLLVSCGGDLVWNETDGCRWWN